MKLSKNKIKLFVKGLGVDCTIHDDPKGMTFVYGDGKPLAIFRNKEIWVNVIDAMNVLEMQKFKITFDASTCYIEKTVDVPGLPYKKKFEYIGEGETDMEQLLDALINKGENQ